VVPFCVYSDHPSCSVKVLSTENDTQRLHNCVRYLCKICGCCSSSAEDLTLVGCDTVLLRE
jgi:hypothetical protein